MADGLDFGTIMEIASGVINSLKPQEEGKKSIAFDSRKLAFGLGSIGLRFIFGEVMSRKQRKAEEMEKALDYLREQAGIKKKRSGPSAAVFFVVGLVLSSGITFLRLSSEERSQLIKGVDYLVNEGIALANEIQGRPYTSDYELNKG